MPKPARSLNSVQAKKPLTSGPEPRPAPKMETLSSAAGASGDQHQADPTPEAEIAALRTKLNADPPPPRTLIEALQSQIAIIVEARVRVNMRLPGENPWELLRRDFLGNVEALLRFLDNQPDRSWYARLGRKVDRFCSLVDEVPDALGMPERMCLEVYANYADSLVGSAKDLSWLLGSISKAAELFGESSTPGGGGNGTVSNTSGCDGRVAETGKLKERRPRIKREVVEPLIADHLKRWPYGTVVEVASAVRCSEGVVSESTAWKLNQRRLRFSKQQGIDPKAVDLSHMKDGELQDGMKHIADTRSVEPTDEAEKREGELFRQIGEHQKLHPKDSPQDIASAVGCTAGDVERRPAVLNRLIADYQRENPNATSKQIAVALLNYGCTNEDVERRRQAIESLIREQEEGLREDEAREDPDMEQKKPRKWVTKQV